MNMLLCKECYKCGSDEVPGHALRKYFVMIELCVFQGCSHVCLAVILPQHNYIWVCGVGTARAHALIAH